MLEEYAPTWATGADTVDEHTAPHLDRAALLIIDTQVDFVDGGASPIPGTTAVLPAISGLRGAFLEAGRPVIHVIRIYDGTDIDLARRTLISTGSAVVARGAPGSAVVAELRDPGAPEPDAHRLLAGEIVSVGPGEVVMWKPRWSAFYRTALDEHLRSLGVDTVVVAGCNFPNCPRATVVDASERDYRVLLAADATSGVRDLHLVELGAMAALHTSSQALQDVLRAH